MPLQLPIADLRPGMKLARPVLSGHRLVLPAGKALNEPDLESLGKDPGAQHAIVLDSFLDEAVEFQDDTQDCAISSLVRRKFMGLMREAQKRYAAGSAINRSEYKAIETSITEIVRFMTKHPVSGAAVTENHGGGRYLEEQAGSTFYLALVMGQAVSSFISSAAGRSGQGATPATTKRPPNLAPLGVATLLKDMSLWQVFNELDHPGLLDSAQRALVHQHPEASAEILPDGSSPIVHAAIRHHHESHNGMGYPHRLAGTQIPLFARLMRVADAYSAATTQSAYQKAKSTVLAFWEMTAGPYAQFYDPVVLKVFQAVVQPYPVGAKVRLACGRYGVVIRHGRHHGLLPVIIIAFDERGKPLPPRLLEGPYALDQAPEHRIVSYNGEDLTGVYGSEPVYTDDPPDPGAFTGMAASVYP